jgi:hypothetical protein
MTYSDIHTLLFERIREQRSWPDAGSSTKLAEQLQFIYAATIKVARDAKASVLDSIFKTSSLTLVAKPTGATGSDITHYSAALPADLFRSRPDMGIVYMLLDDETIVTDRELSSVSSFFRMIAKKNQYGNRLVATDFSIKNFLLHGASKLELNYIPLPTKPVDTGAGADLYSILDFPLPSPFEEEVVALAMMHVEAVLTGNTGKSQISGLIAELYSSEKVGVEEVEG